MTMHADEDFADLHGLELTEGRYFDPHITSDATSAVVINEAAVRAMGLSDPVGMRIHKEWGGVKPGKFVTIVGVLRDFHFASFHQEIQPMIIRPFMDRWWNYTSVKIRPESTEKTLGVIEAKWKNFTGGQPFEYSFMDTDFNRLYKSEQRTGRIFGLFGLLALFVACLGLFGLLSFNVERRTKEIGIRRILGASILFCHAEMASELRIPHSHKRCLLTFNSLVFNDGSRYFRRLSCRQGCCGKSFGFLEV